MSGLVATSPSSTTSLILASRATRHTTDTTAGGDTPSLARGVTRVHNTTPSASGSPLATPCKNSSSADDTPVPASGAEPGRLEPHAASHGAMESGAVCSRKRRRVTLPQPTTVCRRHFAMGGRYRILDLWRLLR